MGKRRIIGVNLSSVSHAPFATVGKGGKCPACGWSPKGGGLYGCGISMSLRIHCYREHGLRLALGRRSRKPAAAAPVDLDAEVAAHQWIVDRVLKKVDTTKTDADEVAQEARMALTTAVLQWDRGKNKSFCYWAMSVIHRRISRKMSQRQQPRPGEAVRVQLAVGGGPARPGIADVREAMRGLSDIERMVMDRMFGDKPETGEEIGRSIGTCKSRVYQIRDAAIDRLRAEFDMPKRKRRRPSSKRRVATGSGRWKLEMTTEAVRDELARNGPMTARQISQRLILRKGYMETRHPGVGGGNAERVVRAAACRAIAGADFLKAVVKWQTTYAVQPDQRTTGEQP